MIKHATVTTATETDDGRHDFDFVFGRWHNVSRRLDNPLDPESAEWSEFEAVSEARPILGGLGNVDEFDAPDFPGRGHFHGFSLRLFDPESRVWRIWWASSVGDGLLDEPVIGRFEDGRGVFECDDVLHGKAIKVRYEWAVTSATSARWEQSFSFDEGRSFVKNWTMDLTRIE